MQEGKSIWEVMPSAASNIAQWSRMFRACDYPSLGMPRNRSRDSRSARWRVSGITMLEVLIALALFGVLAKVAAPAIVELKASFDRNAAKQGFEYDLRRARSEALSKGVRVIITLAADGKSYAVGDDLLAYDTTNGVADIPLFNSTLPKGVTLSFSGTGANATKLIFSSRGFLSDIGGNRNTSQRVATLSYNGAPFATATIYPVGVASFSS